ncbi:MAG TPA: LCP family protein, partial [Clostridia bacterium]|nr:LCP family protein [Clostridia bacterium]
MGKKISDEEAEKFKPWTPAPNQTLDPSINPDDLDKLRYNTDIYTVLFIGVDTNDEREAQNFGYQSDTLMLLAVDVSTYKSYMISIPRDTLTTINKLDKNGKITGTKYTKINAAFSYGG